MAPPATFIAVQCCQCSTMQVKQKNKSSNKWTCVVCNQKQSVRKVYSQGFMAKDVRKFVQCFNMTRQLAEQNQLLLNTDQFDALEEGFMDSFPSNPKQRRTDWAEYLDPPEEDTISGIIGKTSEDDEFDVKVVTEMPKPVFKKPKLRNPSISSTGGKDYEYAPEFNKQNSKEESSHRAGGNDYDYAPTFNKRNSKGEDCRRVASADSSLSKWSTKMVKENLREMPYALGSQTEDVFVDKMGSKNEITKWKGNENCAQGVKWGNKSAKAAGASSKWSIYISDDNEDLQLGSGKDFTDRESEFNDDATGSELIDQRVEEDIHPDFL